MSLAAIQNLSESPVLSETVSLNPSEITDSAAEARKHVLAEKYKTRMCRNFETQGSCPYEHRCMFAHGEQELRTKEMNLRDGLTSEEAIRNFHRMLKLRIESRERTNSLRTSPSGKGQYSHDPYALPMHQQQQYFAHSDGYPTREAPAGQYGYTFGYYSPPTYRNTAPVEQYQHYPQQQMGQCGCPECRMAAAPYCSCPECTTAMSYCACPECATSYTTPSSNYRSSKASVNVAHP